MTATKELLARWKAAKGHSSDSAAARALKVRPSAVANWQAETSHANPVAASRMAEDLGLDPLAVLACIEADRAHEGETRKVWARFGKGAFLAIMAFQVLAPTPALSKTLNSRADVTPHYAKRRKLTKYGPSGLQEARPGIVTL